MRLSLNATMCPLSTGRPIPDEVREIRKHASYFVDTSYPKWKLGGIMLEVTDLAGKMRKVELLLENMIARIAELDRELEVVALEAGLAWSYERLIVPNHDPGTNFPDGFVPLYDVYPNRMITQMWNILRLTRIILREGIIESCSLSSHTGSEAQSARTKLAIIDVVREICASVPQMTNCDYATRHKLSTDSTSAHHSHTMSHILDVYVLIFSLYIVA